MTTKIINLVSSETICTYVNSLSTVETMVSYLLGGCFNVPSLLHDEAARKQMVTRYNLVEQDSANGFSKYCYCADFDIVARSN